jgi:hypothetical protein
VADFCEYSNELPVSVKGGEFLERLLASHEGLSILELLELVSNIINYYKFIFCRHASFTIIFTPMYNGVQSNLSFLFHYILTSTSLSRKLGVLYDFLFCVNIRSYLPQNDK